MNSRVWLEHAEKPLKSKNVRLVHYFSDLRNSEKVQYWNHKSRIHVEAIVLSLDNLAPIGWEIGFY